MTLDRVAMEASQPANIQLIRTLYEAFTARDVEKLLTVVAPDLEFFPPVTASRVERGEPYRGHEGMRTYFDDVSRIWRELEVIAHEYRDLGDRVLVFGRVYARGEGGYISDSPAQWLWRIEDGLIAWGRVFTNRAEALRGGRRRGLILGRLHPMMDARCAIAGEVAVSSDQIVLEAVPNVSEGRDQECIEAFGRALATHGASLLDVHSDADHNRSVYTLVGGPQEISDSVVAGARSVIEHVDMRVHEGAHPCIGALDVVPIVYLRPAERELAHDAALAVANRLAGELDLPVFAYGELATSDERRERAFFRDGGVAALAGRLETGELAPDFGPARMHPTAGAALVGARPPLVAFNVELDTDDVEIAKKVAAGVRENARRPAGGARDRRVLKTRGRAQVSTNVQDPFMVPLGEVVEAVRARRRAARGIRGRGGAGRAGAGRRARGIPGRRRAARVRRAPPRARAPHSGATRINRPWRASSAGGESTGARRRAPSARARSRPRSRGEAKMTAEQRRQERLNRPPTWSGAIGRGALAAVSLFALLVLLLDAPVAGAVGLALLAAVIYTPGFHAVDVFMYRRRQRKREPEPH